MTALASRISFTAAAAVAAPVLAFAHTFRAAPLPRPTPLADAGGLPAADPPPDMRIYALPTGVTHRNGAQAHRGGSFLDKRDFAMAGTLIRHPQGDILVDTGFGRGIDEQFASMPAWFRRVTRWTRWTTAADLLDEAGYGRSHDVYGDGSVVCVPAPGHTPGGVIVFVTLPNGTRYVLIGDVVWQREALDLLEERPWIFRRFGDLDPDQLRHDIRYLRTLKDRYPELIIVPAHDRRGFAEMPSLPASFARS